MLTRGMANKQGYLYCNVCAHHTFCLLSQQQTETHRAEPQVPEPSAFVFEMAIEKLKSHKSPSTGQIPAELIKAGGRTLRSDIH